MPIVSKAEFPLGYNKDIFKDLIDSLEIAEEGRVVTILTYIRTDRSNEIICFPEKYLLKDIPTDSGVYKNLVLDTSYYEGKRALEKAFTVTDEEGINLLAYNSVCFPVGTVVTFKNIYVVSNVIVSTKIFESDSIKLNEGVSLLKIDSLEPQSSLEAEAFKSMILVKESD